MKLRTPKRFASAITRIKTALGEDECARAVNRSTSLIRKWADPDHASRPNLSQALALDVAFVEAGHGEPPLLSLYQQRLARAVAKNKARPLVDVALATLAVQAVVGDLSQSVVAMRARADDKPSFTPNETAQVLALLERLQQQVAQIEEALDDDIRRLE